MFMDVERWGSIIGSRLPDTSAAIIAHPDEAYRFSESTMLVVSRHNRSGDFGPLNATYHYGPEGIDLKIQGTSRNDVQGALDAGRYLAQIDTVGLEVNLGGDVTPAWTIAQDTGFVKQDGLWIAKNDVPIPERTYDAPEFPLEATEVTRRLRKMNPLLSVRAVRAEIDVDQLGQHYGVYFCLSEPFSRSKINGSIRYYPNTSRIIARASHAVHGLDGVVADIEQDIMKETKKSHVIEMDIPLYHPPLSEVRQYLSKVLGSGLKLW